MSRVHYGPSIVFVTMSVCFLKEFVLFVNSFLGFNCLFVCLSHQSIIPLFVFFSFSNYVHAA